MSGPFSPAENLKPFIPELEGHGLDLRSRLSTLTAATGAIILSAGNSASPDKDRVVKFALDMHQNVCRELGTNGHPGDLEMEIGETQSGDYKQDEPVVRSVFDALRGGLHSHGAQIDLKKQLHEKINDIYMVTDIPDVYIKSSAPSTYPITELPQSSDPQNSVTRYSLVGHNKVPPEVRTALAMSVPIEPILHYNRFHFPQDQYEVLFNMLCVEQRTNIGSPSGLWSSDTNWRATDAMARPEIGSPNLARRIKDFSLHVAHSYIIERQLLFPEEYEQAVSWAKKVSSIKNAACAKVGSALKELDARLSAKDGRCITLLIEENEDMREEYNIFLIANGLKAIEKAKAASSTDRFLQLPDLLYSVDPNEVIQAIITLRDMHGEIAGSLTDIGLHPLELGIYASGLAKVADKWTEDDRRQFIDTLQKQGVLPSPSDTPSSPPATSPSS